MSEEDQAAAPAPSPRRRIPVWQESLLLLGLAIVLALVVKTFLVQAFYIPSGSMEPGLALTEWGLQVNNEAAHGVVAGITSA